MTCMGYSGTILFPGHHTGSLLYLAGINLPYNTVA